ncbi:MAG: cell division protein FtsA [Patescibacteria group bacterium]|nr:cell division protein FtsA [Patescibacteria group bacterium]MDE2438362.1 cell division protein FtsA [Patescibacteria group bacterium]
MKNSFAGLDIGTSTIRAVWGYLDRGKVHIMGAKSRPSEGMRNGMIVDMDEARKAVVEFCSELDTEAREALKDTYVNVGGYQSLARPSRGVVAVARADGEIAYEDIDRVIQASQAINLPLNRSILHVIPREYFVDGVAIKDPLGMNGIRLEVDSLVVDTFSPVVKNITKCLEPNIRVGGMVFVPLAASRSVVTKNEREIGVVVIDIGAGTTSLAVFEEGKLLHASIFPVGSNRITNDIAIGLKIPVEAAERVKLMFANNSEEMSRKESLDLSRVDPSLEGKISKRFVAEIIGARLSEIFDFIKAELKTAGDKRLPGGVVVIGGGAGMDILPDLVKAELKMVVRMGEPFKVECEDAAVEEMVRRPEFATATGLFFWGADEKVVSVVESEKGFVNKIKKILKVFIP